MNHKSGFNALSRTSSHRRAMLRNMTTSLFRYERITTTKAKALEVRKCAEKLITRAKVDSVHNRREAAKFIQDEIVHWSSNERPRWWLYPNSQNGI